MTQLVDDSISSEDIQALSDWLSSGPRLTRGVVTKRYEEKWSNWLGIDYSVAVNSGSSAILLALNAIKQLNKTRNDKVVVPDLCWATDLMPVLQLGLTPILCDCNLDNLSVDLEHLEHIFIEENPSILLLVSVLGISPDMNKILALCKRHNVLLMEDACESLGTKYDNKNLGTFGYVSMFSTYFSHHISTIEGGMVCTNDKEFYEVLISTQSHGWSRGWPQAKRKLCQTKYGISDFDNLYSFYYLGMNLRPTEIQSFLGERQLDKLDDFISKRHRNYGVYKDLISESIWKPTETNKTLTSSFAYPIIHKDREKIVNKLRRQSVETRPLICGAMHKQPFFIDLGLTIDENDFPNCNRIYREGFYVPNHPSLTTDEIAMICETINNAT